MKFRYMIDSILRNGKSAKPTYEPVGVWVQGPAPAFDIEMFYIDSQDAKVESRREYADAVINRLVENDVHAVPEDFLDYHKTSRSSYDGMFSEIVTTEEYQSLNACGAAILAGLK